MSVHICHEPTEVTHAESVGERWCFRCRTRSDFQFVIHTPVSVESYYDPTPSIRCGTCQRPDTDLFPGRYRDWNQP